ncbi:diaminopimelate epimerase [Corynebacterium striatum]|uniref:diaminopimelate epimerase n=1 Tax=Corynebacterium striatum TaxID=43770 RepID=UPI000DFF60AB|nr:diaminopimelate epimerase [Corynebacterium striatum]STD37457.1 diaminopimelate epimerase [Corynebacterium striatum]
MKFAKGHGTENDFVIIEDHEGTLELSSERVRVLCDRRAGIGGDGLLRVVRAGALGEPVAEGIAPADWFMDYRNADGSVAEMCGNGTRVFAHWVRSRGLVDSESFVVGTRAGAKQVTVHSFDEHDALVSVEMGPAEVTGVSTASMVGENFAGLGVDMGNPHLAAVIPGLTPESLEDMAFAQPEFDHEFFPHGVNVEVLTQLVDGAVSMRVFERGAGETRSCGTGTVAAARAALADAGEGSGTVIVNVPGGQVQVEIFDGGSRLTGPSRIVAEGTTVL